MVVERQHRTFVPSAVLSFEHRGRGVQSARRAGPPQFQLGRLQQIDRGRHHGDGTRCRNAIKGRTGKRFDVCQLRDLPTVRNYCIH